MKSVLDFRQLKWYSLDILCLFEFSKCNIFFSQSILQRPANTSLLLSRRCLSFLLQYNCIGYLLAEPTCICCAFGSKSSHQCTATRLWTIKNYSSCADDKTLRKCARVTWHIKLLVFFKRYTKDH